MSRKEQTITSQKEIPLNYRGKVYSFTTVTRAPAGFEKQAPYTVALVKVNDGPMVTAQLTDLGEKEPEIGMEVEMVTRNLKTDGDRGIIVYGYKFRPPIKSGG